MARAQLPGVLWALKDPCGGEVFGPFLSLVSLFGVRAGGCRVLALGFGVATKPWSKP